jgi:hypothetical protein
MNKIYKEALSEVEFILERLGPEEMTKIPKTFQEFISENKCKWHEITEEDELKEETLAILAIIYRKFLAPPEERERLEKEYLEKLKKEKEENKKKQNSSKGEINYNFQPLNVEKVEEKKIELIELEEPKWYMKLINKLKAIIR